jgi:hypothetical protein
MIRESWAYIQNTNDEWDKVNNRMKVNVPTVEGLALHLEVTRSTVYLWQKEHPDFSDIIETLLQKQAKALINNGLGGGYNPTIAKVLLTKHGYSDRQEVEQKTIIKDERIDASKLTDEELRILAELQRKSGTSTEESKGLH